MGDVAQLKLSDKGRDVLAEREGMRLTAYLDKIAKPPVWTIGLGHTSAAGPPKVTPGLSITEDEAWEIFRRDVQTFRTQLRGAIRVPVEQHQFDALASFIFNIGAGGFKGSTVLKRLNAGDYAGAGEAMLMWNKPPEIMARRRGEHAQFTKGDYVARIA
jgi:lysozyme